MTRNVEYIEEQQVEFIGQLEQLLHRAREGKTIGCVIFEMDNEGYIEAEHLGILPDDRYLIGCLSEQIADCTTNMSVNAVFDAMEAAK